jgi:hypothetical protein
MYMYNADFQNHSTNIIDGFIKDLKQLSFQGFDFANMGESRNWQKLDDSC